MSTPTFNDYQERAATTAIYPQETVERALDYLVPALAAEAGEVAGKWAKVIRDGDGYVREMDVEEMVDEVGDVLWTAALIAGTLGLSLSDVAEANLHKLASRQDRNKLGGSGDHR